MTPLRVRRPGAALTFFILVLLGAIGCASEPPRVTSPSTPSTEVSPSPSARVEPHSTPEELRYEHAVELVTEATTREKVGSIIMATTAGTDPTVLSDFVTRHALGGFIFMGDNIPATPELLRSLTDQVEGDPTFPVLTAVDQEGGVVSRLPWDTFAGATTLKFEDPSSTTIAFASRSELLAEGGIAANFGIVADYSSDPTSFIYDRALGVTAVDSAARVAAAVQGETGNVISTLKHFPGHGAAAGDSHTTLPETAVDRDGWDAEESLPFRAGIDAGAHMLMFGHLRYSAIDSLPASVSPTWHKIAREDLGFDGIAVTDDLGMLLSSGLPEYSDPAHNAVQALAAGNDLIVIVVGTDEQTLSATIDGVTQAVDTGALPVDRLDDAAVRIAELRLELGSVAAKEPATTADGLHPHS